MPEATDLGIKKKCVINRATVALEGIHKKYGSGPWKVVMHPLSLTTPVSML